VCRHCDVAARQNSRLSAPTQTRFAADAQLCYRALAVGQIAGTIKYVQEPAIWGTIWKAQAATSNAQHAISKGGPCCFCGTDECALRTGKNQEASDVVVNIYTLLYVQIFRHKGWLAETSMLR
jgi:hypothetical protein